MPTVIRVASVNSVNSVKSNIINRDNKLKHRHASYTSIIIEVIWACLGILGMLLFLSLFLSPVYFPSKKVTIVTPLSLRRHISVTALYLHNYESTDNIYCLVIILAKNDSNIAAVQFKITF